MLSLATRRLAAAGCVAAEEEAEELAAAALEDVELLGALVDRRTTGEPIAWITGTSVFCGRSVTVTPGVYVPRWQSERLAERAAALLPPEGRAIDLGTGSGAIACVLLDRHPAASVLGTESDPVAAQCAATQRRHRGRRGPLRGRAGVLEGVGRRGRRGPSLRSDRRDRVPSP